MCTAVSLNTKEHYFGRNLDLDNTYGEQVCVTPRHYSFSFRKMGDMQLHYAIIGMATIANNYPLYYDAVNEYGLAMAGLDFPDNAYFPECIEGKDNVAPFEFIPWILGQCKTVKEAQVLLNEINLTNIPYSENFPIAPLHWMIADKVSSIVIEPRKSGLCIYDNPVGVLTNNPPFEYQLKNLENYRNLRVDNKEVKKEINKEYSSYSLGLGALGLPGDVSSESRFVRAVFAKENSVSSDDELSSVGQFFHILTSVARIKGICKSDKGIWDVTVYSSCMNQDKGLYYYTTYDNRQITCVNMHNTDLDGKNLSCYPLLKKQNIEHQN